MTKLVKLFEPGKIGTMKVKNRIVLAPLGVPRVATRSGYLSQEYMAYFEARAKGGTGLLQTSISSLGPPWAVGPLWAPGSLSMVDDEHIDTVKSFVDNLHAYGAKVSFQITHHGVVLSTAIERLPPEKRPLNLRIVAPSSVPFAQNGVVPYALTTDEIQSLIECFGQAAKRGKAAGFDVVRVQGCHGYLIHQFLSPRTNKRNDEYGGSVEKRARFACDIIKRIRKEVGKDYPIIIRFNGDDFLEGGVTVDQSIVHAQMFEEAGVNGLDISTGPFESHHWQFVTLYQPFGPLIPVAAKIKKAVKIPVIVVGKINVELAERALEEGAADFIHFGRPLMVDPELPNKAKAGKLDDIRPCIYCTHCQQSHAGDPTAQCAVNPAFGKELEFKIEPAAVAKKIMVVGGGPAGMEAARTLAERGHSVSLYEQNAKLGGQWNILSAYREEEAVLTKWQIRGLKQAGVKVNLNTEVTQQMVQKLKPDAVVIATGAKAVIPENIPGINGKNVVMANDVLTGKVKTGKEVVVIGGHLVGLDAALYLAEQGKKVTVVEMKKIAWEVGHILKMALLEYLVKYNVRMFSDTRLESVTDNGAFVIWDGGEPATRGGPRFELLFLKADTIVLATGSRADNRLAERLGGLGMKEVYNIGDSVQARDVFFAIHEGSDIGRKL